MSLLGLIGFGKRHAPKLGAHRPPLPAKLFGELTGFDHATKSRLGDRRRRPRLARDRRLLVALEGNSHVYDACVRDVSVEGISLGMDVELTIGTRFVTDLERLLGDGHVQLVYEVRRIFAESACRYFVGALLVEYRC